MSDKTTINTRLIEFHTKFKGVDRTGVNAHFKAKYPTLDDVVTAVTKPLADVGLYIRHRIDLSRDAIITELVDVDGEMIATEWPFIRDPNPQVSAKTYTYGRRYNMLALLNCGDLDDDGQTAAQEAEKRRSRNDQALAKAEAEAANMATDEQMLLINDYIEAGAISPARAKWINEDKQGKITKDAAEKILAEAKAAE